MSENKEDWECDCESGYGGPKCQMKLCDGSLDCGEYGYYKI